MQYVKKSFQNYCIFYIIYSVSQFDHSQSHIDFDFNYPLLEIILKIPQISISLFVIKVFKLSKSDQAVKRSHTKYYLCPLRN